MTKTDKKLVTHGMYSWLRTGRINPSIRGHKKLQAYLQDMERNLIADQGGLDNLTAAKEIIIKSTIEAYGAILLASMFCKREGILRPDRLKEGVIEMQPVWSHQAIAFLNCLRQNLALLGIDKRQADDVLSPLKLAERIDEEKAREAKNGEAKPEEKEKGNE